MGWGLGGVLFGQVRSAEYDIIPEPVFKQMFHHESFEAANLHPITINKGTSTISGAPRGPAPLS